MRMDTNIRVRTERRYRDLYNQLRNVVVGDNHELFFICACIGYRKRSKLSLGSKGEDRFWSSTIRPEEWCCYYAMVLEDNGMDFSCLKDDKKVISLIEEYANSGMKVLSDYIHEYIIDSGEVLSLDSATKKDLPKILLHYMYDESLHEQ